MTTIFRKSVECANCRNTSEHSVLGSTNAFGSSDLDLRPPEMQRSTMRLWLQQCPTCGYVAADISRPHGDMALIGLPDYQKTLKDRRFPEGARRFLACALLNDKANPAVAAHSRLHAAWVCDDAGETAQAKECRFLAAEGFARLKPFEDSEPGVTQGTTFVDVLRRSGRFEQAAAECGELLSMQAAQGIVRQVLEYQRRLIADRDEAGHRVEEAVAS